MASFLVLFSADEIGGIPVTYPRPPSTHLVLSAIKKSGQIPAQSHSNTEYPSNHRLYKENGLRNASVIVDRAVIISRHVISLRWCLSQATVCFLWGSLKLPFVKVKQRVKHERQFQGLSVQDEAKLGSPLSCMSHVFFFFTWVCLC